MPVIADDLKVFLTLVDTEMKLKPHLDSFKQLINKNKVSTALSSFLIILRDTADRRDISSHPKVLRVSANLHVKDSIYVNPDLMLLERQEGFSQHSKLRRRLAAGETDFIIRNRTIA